MNNKQANQDNIIIAIDAMSGSNAPESIIKALCIANKCYPDIHFLVYGDSTILSNLLASCEIQNTSYTICHTNSIVLDTDKPTDPLKIKKDSSMRGVIDALLEKKAIACVSSGNTGALMLTARMVLGSILGIKRPAIAGIFPTLNTDRTILLDMGANIGCDEVVLSQFAVMGACLAKVILGKLHPSIGILNVGTEHTKGRELEHKTYAILSESMENFIGYVEGHDVIHGKADVVVTDGFSGNILIKASEGAAKTCLQQMRCAFETNIITKLCALILKPYLKRNLEFLDPKYSNGAMFVGINGIVVKSHGSSDDIAFANAIGVAINLVKHGVNQKIIDEMNTLSNHNNIHSGDILEKIKTTSARIFGLVTKND